MREADHHVHRTVADLHDLRDRAIHGFQDRARIRGLVDAGDDQSRGLLRPEQAQQLFLLQNAVAGIGKLNGVAATFGRIVNTAQHIGEYVVGEGRDHDADDFGAVRCECARGEIGYVPQFLHRAIDAFPLAQRQRFGVPEKTRCRDWADASKLGDLGEADFARLCLFSSHLALISQQIRRLNNY